MDFTAAGTTERLTREEEGRRFLEGNGVYRFLFGEGQYKKITDKDLQNWGHDVHYYTDLYNRAVVDEKERIGNKDYYALKVSAKGPVKGLTERVFVSPRQQSTHWLCYRTVHVGKDIAFAEGYLLDVEKTRTAVTEATGKDMTTIYEWSNMLRDVTINYRTLKLNSKSDIILFCNKAVEAEYVEIRLPESFLQKVCEKHFKVKKGGNVEEI